jgi:RNA polymerase sigma factor (sigma-70 family)
MDDHAIVASNADELRVRCKVIVERLNRSRQWGLTSEDVEVFVQAVLPYARKATRKPSGTVREDRLATIIEHHHDENAIVTQLLAAGAKSPEPPASWRANIDQFVSREYKLGVAEATEFVDQVWPFVLRSLTRYHYESTLQHWIQNIALHFGDDKKEYLAAGAGNVGNWLRPDSPLIMGLVRKICAKIAWDDDPDDLEGRVQIDVLKGLNDFYFGCRLHTWVEQIARNCAYRRYAERVRHGGQDEPDSIDAPTGSGDDPGEIEDPSPNPYLKTEQEDMIDYIKRKIRRHCGERALRVVELVSLDELSYREVAERLGIKAGYVGVIYSRTLSRMRKILAEEERSSAMPDA